MKAFPRNCERRAIWAKNVGRKDWTPTNNSHLCEIHFAPDMWQQRFDGKGKLKKDAVPTIFGFFLKNKNVVNNNLSIKNNESQNVGCEVIMNTSESSLLAENNDDVPDNISNNQLINNKSQDVGCEIITFESSCTTCMNLRKNSQCKGTAEIINKQFLQVINMRRKIKTQRKTIEILETKIKNGKYKRALTSIFNEDQIQTLMTKKRS